MDQYWSATAYDRETHALIQGASRPRRASNSADVKANDDGSVTLYFGPKAPAGQESNWVPTNGRNFEVLFRLYGPQPALFDKSWKLPDFGKCSDVMIPAVVFVTPDPRPASQVF